MKNKKDNNGAITPDSGKPEMMNSTSENAAAGASAVLPTALRVITTVVPPGQVIFSQEDTFYQKGVGSETHMDPFNGSFTVPEGGACAELSLEVDDWGKISINGPGGSYDLDMTPEAPDVEPGQYGGHRRWKNSRVIDYLLPGQYSVAVSHENIDMPDNSKNDSYCSYRIVVRTIGSTKDREIPEVGFCSNNSCAGEDGDDRTDPSLLPPSDTVDFCKGKVTPTDEEGPDFVALTALGRASSAPASFGMKYENIWAWKAELGEGLITITPTSGQPLYFHARQDSSEALPVSISRKRDFRVQLQAADGAPCTAADEVAYLMLADASGQRVRFSAESGEVVSVTSATGRVLTAEEHENNFCTTSDADGNMTACFSATEGLMLVEDGENEEKLVSWFAPEQVSRNEDGSFATEGEPYKTAIYSISYVNGVRTVSVTRQQRGLSANTVTRTVEGNRVTITKGEGDDAVIHTYETNPLSDDTEEIIETVRSANDAEPLSCSREVRTFTSAGWLTMSHTEAYNTPLARTTTYEYNEQYRIARETRPDGGFTSYEYDDQNRLTVQTTPWGSGSLRRTRYEYAPASARFYDTRPVKVSTAYQREDGTFATISTEEYLYEDTPQQERTTTITSAAGVEEPQVRIEETYGEAAEYPYAAGKAKFSQAVDGVQTLHSYEATTEHAAVHLHTTITQADGALVPAHSRKTEEFIAADDTVTFTQESVWDGSQWLLLSTEAYEYDSERRRIRTTRGNGRTSTTEWMCCGVLREVDEDGILTSHAYNSAKQHLGTTRSAVMDGDMEITPETLEESTLDALGRTVAERREVGPMVTVLHTAYDALDREVRQTDALGRVTTTEYSADGRTTTVTTPTGATLITTSNPDGSTASVSGTGQRERHYRYSYDDALHCLCTTVLTSAGEILSRTYTNGFGQVVISSAPSTAGLICTHSVYNAKGQVVKTYRSAGELSEAPKLYEYDAMGNPLREIHALSEEPTKDNSPVQETAYSVEQGEDGVYSVVVSTRYNAQGEPLTNTQKSLISSLTGSLESKSVSIDERGNVSASWSEYAGQAKRMHYTTVPTAAAPAVSCSVDGFTISQTDHAGITTTMRRHYGKGLTLSRTDGRGNTTTTLSDVAGRTISETDAAGHTTTTEYSATGDLPSKVTDAMGNTTCYTYDARGRKVAEWGSAVQPACFGYDEADRMISLTTFRAGSETISSDPTGRADGDTTTWEYHDATGLEVRKSYADGSQVSMAYDAFNRLATETDARGVTKSHAYDPLRGLQLSTTYSDGSAPRLFAYDHLGNLTQVTDAAGVRSLRADAYGEPEVDELLADGARYTLTEQRDSFGRSVGFTYAVDGAVQHAVSISYAADGRIASAAFEHGGVAQRFEYGYLPGSNLLAKLSHPSGVTLTQSFEEKRDLLTEITYQRGGELLTRRSYTYDALGRPTARDVVRGGELVRDSFMHNSRSELISAQVDGELYGYDYDNIGNRRLAIEGLDSAIYQANELNQYTAIHEGAGTTFSPLFDAAGNQTLVKTGSGVWRVTYNAENRPISFTSEDGSTVVESDYDYQGRRCYKKITTNGEVTLHQRYLYRGFLQIAACNLLPLAALPAAESGWRLLWDPSQPTATRPLAMAKGDDWFSYAWDLTKNITELYDSTGSLRTAYTYTPFGAVATDGDVDQPIQWSSEFHDAELELVYYNHRHYNPLIGRWFGRDPEREKDDHNLYRFVKNMLPLKWDFNGLWMASTHAEHTQVLADARINVIYFFKGMPYIISTISPQLKYLLTVRNKRTDLWHMSDHKYHFTAPNDLNVGVYRKLYEVHIDTLRTQITSALARKSPDCSEAVTQLGRLIHMWQDYYGHGRNPKHDGKNPDPGQIVGSPSGISANPSTYSWLGFGGNHGSFLNVFFGQSPEPGKRAQDQASREQQSMTYTKTNAVPLIESIIARCACKYYKFK